MPSQVRLNAEKGYLDVEYNGSVSPLQLQQALQQMFILGRELKPLRVLTDCSRLEGGHSVFDLYDLIESLAADPAVSGLREAVIFRPGSAAQDRVELWENACANRGLQVRAFTEREAGLAWLLA